MKKRTKIFIFTALALVVFAVAGFFIGKYYIVNYAFDRFFETGMAGVAQSAENIAQQEKNTVSTTEEIPTSQKEPTEQKTVEEMTEKEVIKEVMKDSSLISKMSNMISYGDREKIISIVLSNFTSQEISHYSTMIAQGLDSAAKSELMSAARSRLTSAQLSECMQIAYKYADQIRPYLKKN